MTLDSLETVIYTCVFLLPGYLINEITTSIMPVKQYSESSKLFRYLGYSILNLAIWSWMYWTIYNNVSSERVQFWIWLVVMTMVSSMLTGAIIGLLRKNQLFRKLFKHIGIQIEHLIPTAWDYKFSETNNERWVIVRLASGQEVYGKYSTKSFSSSDANNHDLYLEEVYKNSEGEIWKKTERTDGIWISAEEIKSIEFKF